MKTEKGEKANSETSFSTRSSFKTDDSQNGIVEVLDEITWKTKAKKIARDVRNSFRESPFIQNVLLQDSCTEVIVVDMFVALKKAKEDLDNVIQFNHEASAIINVLEQETKVLRTNLMHFFKQINEFFVQIENEFRLRFYECEGEDDSDNDGDDGEEVASPKFSSSQETTFRNQQENSQESLVKLNFSEINILNPMKQNRGDSIDIINVKKEEIERKIWSFSEDSSNKVNLVNDENDCFLSSRTKSIRKVDLWLENRQSGDCICSRGFPENFLLPKQNFSICCSCGRSVNDAKNKFNCVSGYGDPIDSRNTFKPTEDFISAFTAIEAESHGKWDPFSLRKNLKTNIVGFCQEHLNMKKNEDSIDLTESAVEIICDLCEVLNVTQNTGKTSQSSSEKSSKECFAEKNSIGNWALEEIWKRIEKFGTEHSLELDQKSSKREPLLKEECEQNTELESEPGEYSTEGETIFEEALSEPYSNFFEPAGVINGFGMGDLTKSLTEKKSAGTLTANIGQKSSWISKLTEDIKSRIKNFGSSNRKLIFGQKPDSSKSVSGMVEFTLSANTPVGVFDVTVRQYTSPKNESGNNYNSKNAPGTSNLAYNSEKDELEEFIEIYVESSKTDKKTNKDIQEFHNEGVLQRIYLKSQTETCFESFQCRSKNFFHEILPKIAKESIDVMKVKQEKVEENKELEHKNLDKNEENEIEPIVIIKGSSKDLVIYIQLQIEDEDSSLEENNISVKYGDVFDPMNPMQKLEISNENLEMEQIEVKTEKVQQGKFFDFWEKRKLMENGDEEISKMPLNNNASEIGGNIEILEDSEKNRNLIDKVQLSDEKSKPLDEDEETMIVKQEIHHISLTNDVPKMRGTAVPIHLLQIFHQADICLPQEEVLEIIRMEPKIHEEISDIPQKLLPHEKMKKALSLIHKIEDSVTEVKLSVAISILPRLESELRKHLQEKIKIMSRENSTENLLNVLPPKIIKNTKSEESEERLKNLLGLLSNLEESIVSNEQMLKNRSEFCESRSSKIYELLGVLTNNIKELEDKPTLTNIANTVEMASRLNMAVREYDSILNTESENIEENNVVIREQFKENSNIISIIKSKASVISISEDLSMRQHMKNVRKKVFEVVEADAVEIEERIKKNFDRIYRLEEENEEAMTFVEVFLEKTERRAEELRHVKYHLKELSQVLYKLYEALTNLMAQEIDNSTEIIEAKELEFKNKKTEDLKKAKEKPVKDTISHLMLALENLKARAREKGEKSQEILENYGFGKIKQRSEIKISKSSFSATQKDGLLSNIKDLRRIGCCSLYLSWSKPEGSLAQHILGYEIFVNGTLNQKVRNPKRVQAVLYSVDLTQKTTVQLYARLENKNKILLANLTYMNS